MPRGRTLELAPWFLTVPELDPYLDAQGRLDWAAFFGGSRPVEIDVGSGRGMFLVHAANSTPERNFVGIEIDLREAKRAADRLARRKQPNARVIGGDARDVFTRLVRPGSVATVHVYFPDPWWKRRHRRRRVFTDEFVELAATALEPGGLLISWTDVEEYFGVISALMGHSPRFETLPPPPEKPAEHDLDYRTSYERRQRQEGCTIYRGQWRRRGDPSP